MCTAKSVAVHIRLYLFPLLPFVMGESSWVFPSGRRAACFWSLRWPFLLSVLSMPIWSMNIKETRAPLLRTHYAGGCSGICLCGWLYEICCLPLCRSMFRAGNHSGHYGDHRHNDFRAAAQETWYMHGLHAWACWWVLCWALECIRCMVSVW